MVRLDKLLKNKIAIVELITGFTLRLSPNLKQLIRMDIIVIVIKIINFNKY